MMRWLLAAALLCALAAAPAEACTAEPMGVHHDASVAEVHVVGPCPPATNGHVHARVLDTEVSAPLPG